MVTQLELTAKADNQGARDQLDLAKQLQATGEATARIALRQMKLEEDMQGLSPRSVDSGNPFAREPHPHRPPEGPHRQNNDHVYNQANNRPYLPKMHFPTFSGDDPRIWKDKCQEFFKLYNISDNMKTSASSLSLEGNAARWYQVYKLQHGLTTWDTFIAAVEEKFGAYDYKKALDTLLELKQESSVEEYAKEFESVRYQLSMHNPGYDELFFASHFVRGLKDELRGAVQSQVPETVTRACMLAKLQQQVLDKSKTKYTRPPPLAKPPLYPSKNDNKTATSPTGLWKERQLRDYRIAHGLCYFCGEEYDDTHAEKCTKKPKPQLNALVISDLDVQLTEETLNQLKIEDVLSQELCQLSINAISGTESSDSMRVRALVNNQVMLILIDSGSSYSFVNSSFVERLNITQSNMQPVQVQVANREKMITNKIVKNFEWWAQGHTFHNDIRILDIGAYDAILGYDWLKTHSPMVCDWEAKTMSFVDNGKQVELKGVAAPSLAIQELHDEQFAKCYLGNEIWAIAVVKATEEQENSDTPSEIAQLVDEYKDIFGEPKELPPFRSHDHTIPLFLDAVPVNSRPYRYSPSHKDEIERQVKELLSAGLIVHSTSPFASPVLLVQKKDGSWRFCVDCRKLNTMSIKNKFPKPIIDEILDELAGTKYFSSLDFRARFHQIRMHKDDEYKTAFKSHQGHYQFRVMPFVLTNAPATFQCVMNNILEPFLKKFVMVFLDDILVYSPTLLAHIVYLRKVLEKLREHQFYIKRSKCHFAQHKLNYLGHVISETGVATDPLKIQAMINWPVPQSVTELRGFLGLTGYYRKFVHHYGLLAKPVTNLLKKKQFIWSEPAQKAFESLKQAMSSTLVLALPDFNEVFVIETDACD